MTVNPGLCYVNYTDSHFVLIAAETESDFKEKNRKGKILGHYLSSDLANEALNTMKTIYGFGYGHTLTTK